MFLLFHPPFVKEDKLKVSRELSYACASLLCCCFLCEKIHSLETNSKMRQSCFNLLIFSVFCP